MKEIMKSHTTIKLKKLLLLLALALAMTFLQSTIAADSVFLLPPERITARFDVPGDTHLYYFFGLENESISINVEALDNQLPPAFILLQFPTDKTYYQFPVSPVCASPVRGDFISLLAVQGSAGGSAGFQAFRIPECGVYMLLIHAANYTATGPYGLTIKPLDGDSNALSYTGNFTGGSEPDIRVVSTRNNVIKFDRSKAESLTFSPAGHSAALFGNFSGTIDKDVNLYDLSTNTNKNTEESVLNHLYSPDGDSIILIGKFDSDPAQDSQLLNLPAGTRLKIQSKATEAFFDPSSRVVAMKGLLNDDYVNDLYIFRTSDGTRIKTYEGFSDFQYSPTGEGMIITGDFTTATGIEFRLYNIPEENQFISGERIQSFQHAPNGRFLTIFGDLTGDGGANDLQLYDYRLKKSVLVSPKRNFFEGQFSPTGEVFVTFGYNDGDAVKDAKIYALPAGNIAWEQNKVDSVTFSPNGHLAVFRGQFNRTSGLKQLRFVSLPTGAELAVIDEEDVDTFYISPGGTSILLEGNIDELTGRDMSFRLTHDFTEYTYYSNVDSIFFEPSNRYYLIRGDFSTTDPDEKWEIATLQTGTPVFQLEDIDSIEFSPSGDTFWITGELDDIVGADQDLRNLPENESLYFDKDFDITFKEWLPRGQGILLQGDPDDDNKEELILISLPEGIQRFDLERVKSWSYSLNAFFIALLGNFDQANDGDDLQIRKTSSGTTVYSIQDDADEIVFSPDEEVALLSGTWPSTGKFGFLMVRLNNGQAFAPTQNMTSFLFSWDRTNPYYSPTSWTLY